MMNISGSMPSGGITAIKQKAPLDWKRVVFLLLGIIFFFLIHASGPWDDAIDRFGVHHALTREGKGAIAILALAALWWVFGVVPVGVTSIAVGLLQGLFHIRSIKTAFHDFMDPSVMFIFASIVIGMGFTKTGLTKRMVYKTLSWISERTAMIYLGVFLVTALLTHIMAYTVVAATIFPLLMAIHLLYGEGDNQTKFGKGLFMGMAYVTSAGSIITLVGAARGVMAISFFNEIAGREMSCFEFTKYMFPVGWTMVFVLWGYFLVFFRPEKKAIPGLRNTVKKLSAQIGPVTSRELATLSIVAVTIICLTVRAFVPALAYVDKTVVILMSTILFFVFRILDFKDLEEIPWNIILLFGGTMSMGLCLWETGAARWMALQWLVLFKGAHWLAIVLVLAFLVLLAASFMMNVVVIAVILPMALWSAPSLGVAPEVVFFSCLVAAGMPFMFLSGAAPNAIAYESRQFTTRELFINGLRATVIIMAVIALAVTVIWPLLGMPLTAVAVK